MPNQIELYYQAKEAKEEVEGYLKGNTQKIQDYKKAQCNDLEELLLNALSDLVDVTGYRDTDELIIYCKNVLLELWMNDYFSVSYIMEQLDAWRDVFFDSDQEETKFLTKKINIRKDKAMAVYNVVLADKSYSNLSEQDKETPLYGRFIELNMFSTFDVSKELEEVEKVNRLIIQNAQTFMVSQSVKKAVKKDQLHLIKPEIEKYLNDLSLIEKTFNTKEVIDGLKEIINPKNPSNQKAFKKTYSKANNKKTAILCGVLVAILLFFILPTVGLKILEKYDTSDGDADAAEYISVTTAEELQNMKTTEAYRLENDIDLTGFNFTPIVGFKGILNGNNKKITNFSLTKFTTEQVGLFATTEEGSVIKDLTLENISLNSFDSAESVGGLVGVLNGRVSNVHITGNIDTRGLNNVGGIAGSIGAKTEISSCSFNGSIKGNNYVGGIIGTGVPPVINDCEAAGEITGNSYVGGIYGGIDFESGRVFTIKSCTNNMNISCTLSFAGGICGGIVCGAAFGSPTVIIKGCINNGNLTGNDYTGGIIGRLTPSNGKLEVDSLINNGTIQGSDYTSGIIGYLSYSKNSTIGSVENTKKVIGNNYVGGIIGSTYYGKITLVGINNTGDVEGSTYVGGLAGSIDKLVDCHNTGKVSASGKAEDGNTYLGGVAGFASEIEKSTNSGEIAFTLGSGVGGIVGVLQGNKKIINCENTGAINGNDGSKIGGICGSLSDAGMVTIQGTINRGDISCKTGEKIGGIIGDASVGNNDANITSVQVHGNILATNCKMVGGIIGHSTKVKLIIHTIIISSTEISGLEQTGSIVGYADNYNPETYQSTFEISQTAIKSMPYIGKTTK